MKVSSNLLWGNKNAQLNKKECTVDSWAMGSYIFKYLNLKHFSTLYMNLKSKLDYFAIWFSDWNSYNILNGRSG